MSKWKQWLGLGLSIVLISVLLIGCGGNNNKNTTGSSEQPANKPFQGKKLTVFVANHPWAETLKTFLHEFESETGMAVDYQSFAEDQLLQKTTVQLTSGANTPDVFMTRPVQEARLFYENGWYHSLDAYVQQDPGYDFADFSESAVASVTVNDEITSIPIISDQQIVYYRKDLLENAGIEVPKTLDEMEQAIQKLHDPDNEIYGFVARGQRVLLVTAVSSFLFSEGGDFMDGNTATVNTPESLKGFKRYGEWLKNYGPPGVMNMSWQQAMGLFAQGKVAFYTDATSIYKNAIDPEKSSIADKVGYAVFPAGDAGAKPYNITPWGLAMNANAADKDAAWEFIKWATNKENTLRTQSMGNPGSRNSVWEDPAAAAGFPDELTEVVKESIKIGVGHALPNVTRVAEARDIIGEIVEKVMLGHDINEAADKANKAFQDIIDVDNK